METQQTQQEGQPTEKFGRHKPTLLEDRISGPYYLRLATGQVDHRHPVGGVWSPVISPAELTDPLPERSRPCTVSPNEVGRIAVLPNNYFV
jgi:hypothetical protein